MCVKTFFISFIFIILTVNCKIVVFYGTYNSASESVPNSVQNWFDCVCWCQETNDCLFVLWNESSQICKVVYSNSSNYLGFIHYTNKTTDMEIALKTNYSNCYDAIEFLKSRFMGCSGRLFRSKYTICAQRYYYHYSNHSAALEKCENEGEVLIGLENQNERVSFANVINKATKYNSSSLIGLTRNSEGMFVWSDPYLTGNGSIVWADGHPIDGNDCASLQSDTSLIQSDNCDYSPCDNSTFCPSIVICGKLLGF